MFKKDSALVPTFLAFAVVGLLEQHFGRLVDYDFTARMEDDLDRIAAGDEERVQWLRRFYYGNGDEGLKDLVSDLGGIDAREVSSIEIGDGIVVRVGRYGPYLERDGRRASVPAQVVPDELTVEKAEELLSQPSEDRTLGADPETGREIVARTGRYGPYVTEVLDEGSKEKPRTASLFQSMALDTITLEDALRLLTIPRVLGVDSADGEEVVARNGRYGPYVQKGKESRSLDSRGAAARDHPRAGARTAVEAEGEAPEWRGRRSAAGAGGRPRDAEAGRREGRPFRPVCDRRGGQRDHPRRRHARDDQPRARVRAAGRTARERPRETAKTAGPQQVNVTGKLLATLSVE